MNTLFSQLRIVLVMICMAGILPATYCQKGINYEQPITMDENVIVGKLDNGLTYYIRQNKKPENRMEMRLVVNAGSILETDEQQGLAHFTEHMAFNGSKHFPKNDLINFMQSIGMTFGGDLNAYTSFDETVYMLTAPTNNEAVVDKAFLALCDWANYLTMDAKEIDKERGIIIEEWRGGLGAADRMQKAWWSKVFNGSAYANRIPIGKPEILKTFKHETLRSFYSDWYRPDLQAVVVVGDIDPATVEAKIKKYFGEIPAVQNPKERTTYSVPDNVKPIVAITSDKEMTVNQVMILSKQKAVPTVTVGDYRDQLAMRIFIEMLNSRFNEYKQNPDRPFVAMNIGYGNFLARDLDAFQLNIVAKDGEINNCIAFALKELNRVKKYGFLKSEFERVKDDILTQYENALAEADKTPSSDFVEEYTDHFLTGEACPGIERETRMVRRLLPLISLFRVNDIAERCVNDTNRVVIVMMPEKEGVKKPTEKEILAVLADKSNEDVTEYVDTYTPEPLVNPDMLKGSPVKEKEVDIKRNLTTLTLKNNVKIVLMPTQLKNDEILMTAYSKGGESLTNEEDLASVTFLTGVMGRSGLGELSSISLEKKLRGKSVHVNPFIEKYSEGLSGSSSNKDLETMLQLTYLYFTAPRFNESACKAYLEEMKNYFAGAINSPMAAYIDTLSKTISQNDPRLIAIPTAEFIDKFDLKKAETIYKQRFEDADDFTFFFVGSFNVDSIIPLLEKYIGSLKMYAGKEQAQNVFRPFPAETKEVEIHKGMDDKATVTIVLSEPFTYTAYEAMKLGMIGDIIEKRMYEIIREKMSGVYSPAVETSLEREPNGHYMSLIQFSCDPKNAKKLSKAYFATINDLYKKGPSDEEVAMVQEKYIKDREMGMNANEFYLGKLLQEFVFNDAPCEEFKAYQAKVKSISKGALAETCKKALNPKHYIKVVMLPEETKK